MATVPAPHYDTITHDHAVGKEISNNGSESEYTKGANPPPAQQQQQQQQQQQARAYDYGGNPLAYINTNEARFPAFGGEFQPGLYKPTTGRKFANPAPLGLSAFALTTFVLSLINIQTQGVSKPNIVVCLAFGYGGLVQLLAGMWEMAVNNTFGATALSSYGGFWISYAIILTPGGFEIGAAYEPADLNTAIGFYLGGWFIFTTILLVCTFRSTVAFFLLFFTLDICFLLLMVGHLRLVDGAPNSQVIAAGGYFGLFAAFLAWYNALAGLADTSNSFFVIPVAHFPWSEKAREARVKSERETV